jgi:hypothetical protein
MQIFALLLFYFLITSKVQAQTLSISTFQQSDETILFFQINHFVSEKLSIEAGLQHNYHAVQNQILKSDAMLNPNVRVNFHSNSTISFYVSALTGYHLTDQGFCNYFYNYEMPFSNAVQSGSRINLSAASELDVNVFFYHSTYQNHKVLENKGIGFDFKQQFSNSISGQMSVSYSESKRFDYSIKQFWCLSVSENFALKCFETMEFGFTSRQFIPTIPLPDLPAYSFIDLAVSYTFGNFIITSKLDNAVTTIRRHLDKEISELQLIDQNQRKFQVGFTYKW